MPSFELDGLSGLFGPSKLSMDVRKKIGADVVAVMADKIILERLALSGQAPAPGGPEALEESVRRQVDQVASIAKLLGMTKK